MYLAHGKLYRSVSYDLRAAVGELISRTMKSSSVPSHPQPSLAGGVVGNLMGERRDTGCRGELIMSSWKVKTSSMAP